MRHGLKRGIALACCAACAASPVIAKPPPRGPQQVSALGGYALPSEIVAASLAWARRAAERNWADAMRENAAPDGQILIGSVAQRAQAYARGKGMQPPASQAPTGHRRTHHVWMSCDGSIAAEEGLFDSGAAHGWYLTLWQRQPKGGYKWVLDQSAADNAVPDFDFIEGKVADCVPRARGQSPAASPPPPGSSPAPDGQSGNTVEIKPIQPGTRPARIDIKGENNSMADYLIGLSRDRTLSWATKFDEDGTRHLTIHLLTDGKRSEVLNRTVAPEAAKGQ